MAAAGGHHCTDLDKARRCEGKYLLEVGNVY